MHPKALLEAATELVRRVLKFEHPADAVVAQFFRDNPRGDPHAELAAFEMRLDPAEALRR